MSTLWVWGENSPARGKYLTQILKNTDVNFAYINYTPKGIPLLNIDPDQDVVLALGGNPAGSPLQELKNNGIVKKNLTLGSSRSKIYLLPSGARCLTSYTASVRDVQYDLFVELQSDVQLAVRLLTTGSLTPPLLDFQWVEDFTEVLEAIEKHQTKWNNTKYTDVAIDLETTGLVAHDPNTWIVTFQISTDETSSRVLKFDEEFQPVQPSGDRNASNCTLTRAELVWTQINQLLNDQRISLKGANLKFDLGWIYEKWKIECTNFRFDTLLVGSLLNENQSNSLKTHASIYTCLSSDTKVLLEDGLWQDIRTLVNTKYSNNVMSWDGGTLVPKQVIGWVKNKNSSKEWWGFELDGFFPSYARFTSDHEIYTTEGTKEIQYLQIGDTVISSQRDFSGDSLKVFLASVLGDGGIHVELSNARFALFQQESKEEYLVWKANIIGGVFNKSIQEAPLGSSNDRGLIYRTSTYAVAIKKWWDNLPRVPEHSHNLPIPTRDLLEKMGALGLAVWYQDDGTFAKGINPSIRCHCTGYEYEALAYFKELFGEDVYYASWGAFVFRKTAAARFFEYLKPYAHPCFDYKYPFDVTEVYDANPSFTLLTGKVKSVGLRKLRRKAMYDSYCLEVADLHNFVTRAGVVSNCYGSYEQEIYQKYNIAEPHKIPNDVLLPYCGYDTAVCLQVARKMKAELQEPTNVRLLKFYTDILHPAGRAYERVERTGVLVDRKYYLEFKKEIEDKMAINLTLAHRTLPGRLISKWREPKDPVKSISLARAAMIADYMFDKTWLNLKPVMFTPKPDKDGNPKPSTALEHFLKFENHEVAGPFVKVLKEYKDYAKTLSTYIDGFLADLRYDDRFHASYFLFKGQEGKEDDAGTNCFPKGVPILTDKGYVPIEQVKVGDLVLTHKGRYKPVTDVFVNGVQPIIQVFLRTKKSLKTTRNHPYYTTDGWVNAEDLTLKHIVFVYDTRIESLPVAVCATSTIDGISYCRSEKTYGITVEDDESHVSGGIITHNSGRLSVKGPALQTLPKKNKWAKSLRRAFIAPEGYVLMSCDYSQGELKILADLSKESRMLWAYNNGLDLHAVTGAGLLGVPVEEFMKYNDSGDPKLQKLYDENRQKAKGCNFGLALSHNSSCLTQLGSVKIQDIQPHHKLWDGVEYVAHDGVITQGEFYVVNWDGLWATPDHKVWIETGEKIEFKDAIKRGAKLRRTATVFGKPILWNDDTSQRGKTEILLGYCTDGLFKLWGVSSSTCKGLVSREYQRGNLWETGQIQPRSKSTSIGDTLRCYGTALQQGYAQTITRLQGQGYSMSLYFQRAFYTLGFGEVSFGELQGVGIRQDRQQGALFSRESTFSNQFGKSSQYGEQCISYVSGSNNVLDGLEKSIPSTKNRGICPERDDGGTNNRTGKGSDTEQVQKLAGYSIKTGGIGVLSTIRDYCTSIYMAWDSYVREKLGKPIQSKENSGISFSGDEWGSDYRLRQKVNKSEAEELASIGVPIKRVRVYDILNAGTRRRFTCEGKLVSNCYGMGAEGFRIYAETAYKVKMTSEEAVFYRNKFFETYPGLEPWYEVVKNKAKQDGYIDSPLGRRRHLPLIGSSDKMVASKELRRAINAPVQGTLSDFSLWATSIAEKEGITKVAPVVLMVHDQLVCYLPKDNWVYYAKRYRDIMENLPFEQFGWKPAVRFTVDCEIGMGDPEKGIPPNLAQLTKASKLCKDW